MLSPIIYVGGKGSSCLILFVFKPTAFMKYSHVLLKVKQAVCQLGTEARTAFLSAIASLRASCRTWMYQGRPLRAWRGCSPRQAS